MAGTGPLRYTPTNTLNSLPDPPNPGSPTMVASYRALPRHQPAWCHRYHHRRIALLAHSEGALSTLPRRQELDLAGAPKRFPHLSVHRRTESPPTLVTSALLARLPRGYLAPSAWPGLLTSGNQHPKVWAGTGLNQVLPYASMPRIPTVQVASYSHPSVPDCLATR